MLKEICANLVGGVGLFFIGIRFIREHAKQMAGRGFRRWIERFTNSPLLSILAGLLAGGLIQSTSAVTFILTSLISSRLISVRRAMPIVAWSNVGNSLLVLLAVLDIRLAALYLLGVTGLGFYFQLDKSSRFRNGLGALLGVGLLFLGLLLIQEGAAPLKDLAWLTRFLESTQHSYLLAFFLGGLLSIVAQSSMAVSVVAIAMARAGLLGLGQTVMLIYGANAGSGVRTFFMASNLRGSVRQLAVFQAIFKAAGALVLVPLFYAEVYLHLPGVEHLVVHLDPDFGRQMAYVYLLFQLAAMGLVSPAFSAIERLLERISPTTEEETLAQPQYIYDQALAEPESALDLVEREQLRLVNYLPHFLDAVREETNFQAAASAVTLQRAVASVGAEVTAFVTDLMTQHQSRGVLERALNLQSRAEVVIATADTLADLVAAALQGRRSESLFGFAQRLNEALHLILLTAGEATEGSDDQKRRTLLELTADRGEMMEQLRRSFLREEEALDSANQRTLMTITTLFERTIWLLRRFGILLAPRPVAASQSR